MLAAWWSYASNIFCVSIFSLSRGNSIPLWFCTSFCILGKYNVKISNLQITKNFKKISLQVDFASQGNLLSSSISQEAIPRYYSMTSVAWCSYTSLYLIYGEYISLQCKIIKSFLRYQKVANVVKVSVCGNKRVQCDMIKSLFEV